MDRSYFGLYPALVADIVDPEHLGRVQVRFPWLGEAGQDVRAWATLLSPYADNDQGLLALPEVDSQVVVGFEAGNLRRPYVVGACWNGREIESSEDSKKLDALEKAGKLKKIPFTDRAQMKKLADPVMAAYAKEIGADQIYAKINAIK